MLYERISVKNRRFFPNWAGWPNISSRRCRPRQPFFLSENRLNDLSYGIKKSGQISLPFCQNPRVRQIDSRTDGRTDSLLIARPRLHSVQRGKNSWAGFLDSSLSRDVWLY